MNGLHAGLALDEGQSVVDEGHLDAVAGGVDPLAGDLALEVGDALQRQELRVAHVLAVEIVALESDHLVGVAIDSGGHGRLAGEVGFHRVGRRSEVRRAALQEGRLDSANLRRNATADDLRELVGETAELGVAEAVVAIGLGLGDEVAVLVVDTLGGDDEALARRVVDALHVIEEGVHVEVHLREVDEIRTGAGVAREGGGGGEPASVAAHHLDDGHHARIVAGSVVLDLHAGSGDVLGGGSVAGAVVRAVQVVVDGLGDAHDAALVAALLHELGNLVAGVHRVVAAVVEEVADIELLEGVENLLVVGRILVRILHLVAAGAEGGSGSELEQLELHRILHAHVIELLVEHARDAVRGAEHAGDLGSVEGCLDSAEDTGVDHGGGAAGLADDTCTFEFFHVVNQGI